MAAAEETAQQPGYSRACEAHFFAGELAVIDGRKTEARTHREQAVATCPRNYVEHKAAETELAALASGD